MSRCVSDKTKGNSSETKILKIWKWILQEIKILRLLEYTFKELFTCHKEKKSDRIEESEG